MENFKLIERLVHRDNPSKTSFKVRWEFKAKDLFHATELVENLKSMDRKVWCPEISKRVTPTHKRHIEFKIIANA